MSAGETILDDEFNVFVASSSDAIWVQSFCGLQEQQFTDLGQAAIDTVVSGRNDNNHCRTVELTVDRHDQRRQPH